MMYSGGQTPTLEFEPTVSASKRPRPMPQTARPLGPPMAVVPKQPGGGGGGGGGLGVPQPNPG
jgi:hypothetical protein